MQPRPLCAWEKSGCRRHGSLVGRLGLVQFPWSFSALPSELSFGHRASDRLSNAHGLIELALLLENIAQIDVGR